MKYTQDSQPDLDVRLADSLRNFGGAVVMDEVVTVNEDGTKSISVVTLTRHTITAIFDIIWEHFIDPNGD